MMLSIGRGYLTPNLQIFGKKNKFKIFPKIYINYFLYFYVYYLYDIFSLFNKHIRIVVSISLYMVHLLVDMDIGCLFEKKFKTGDPKSDEIIYLTSDDEIFLSVDKKILFFIFLINFNKNRLLYVFTDWESSFGAKQTNFWENINFRNSSFFSIFFSCSINLNKFS